MLMRKTVQSTLKERDNFPCRKHGLEVPPQKKVNSSHQYIHLKELENRPQLHLQIALHMLVTVDQGLGLQKIRLDMVLINRSLFIKQLGLHANFFCHHLERLKKLKFIAKISLMY